MRAVWPVSIVVAFALLGCDNRSIAERAEPQAQETTTQPLPMEKVPRRDFVEAMNLCPRLPTGTWKVGDFDIPDRVFSVRQEEADWYANKVISITDDRVLVGEQICEIDEIKLDTYQWTFEATVRAHYIYYCADDRILSFSFGPDCVDPQFSFKEAIYDAVEVVQ